MSDKKWLWHRRLGHANWRLVSKLSKLKLVRGLPGSGKTFLGRSSKHSMLCSEQDLYQTLVEQNSI